MIDGVFDSVPETGKPARRPPVRTFWVSARTLLVVLIILGLSGSGCFKSSSQQGARTGSSLVKATSDDALDNSLSATKYMTKVTNLRASPVGSRLQAVTEQLAKDPDTQESVLRLAWETTCEAYFGRITRDPASLAQYVATSAVKFALTFTGDAAQLIADAVFTALEEHPGDAAAKCIGIGERIPSG